MRESLSPAIDRITHLLRHGQLPVALLLGQRTSSGEARVDLRVCQTVFEAIAGHQSTPVPEDILQAWTTELATVPHSQVLLGLVVYLPEIRVLTLDHWIPGCLVLGVTTTWLAHEAARAMDRLLKPVGLILDRSQKPGLQELGADES